MFLLVFGQMTMAQIQSKISIGTNTISIGDQIDFKIIVENPGNMLLLFPIADENNEIAPNIEAANSVFDTVYSNGKEIKSITQTLSLSSFTEGNYEINSLRVFYQLPNDTIKYSLAVQPFFLHVSGVVVDTTKGIKDITFIKTEPFTFSEIIPYIIVALLIALVIFAAKYIYKRYKQKKPFIKLPVKPAIPAHEIALKSLEELQQKNLWQNNYIKQYYTELTDILRLYLHNRFSIHAIEYTSDEIIAELKNLDCSNQLKLELESLLQTADLVKFAKSIPSKDEHNMFLQIVTSFVKNTIPVEKPQTTETKQ